MSFLRDESGQDTAEYALLLLFVFICSLALFSTSGGSMAAIWSQINELVDGASGMARPK